MVYEWMCGVVDVVLECMLMVGSDWVSQGDVDVLVCYFEDCLDEVGFFFLEFKVEGMKINLCNMWLCFFMICVDI